MSDDGALRTLYIGNLDPDITEDLLYALFAAFGTCSDCKIIREIGHDPYAFVKYNEMKDAQAALMAMNKRNVLGRELKVNWASSPNSAGGKQDTTNHFHVYIGDVSPEIDSVQLRSAFAPFGEISECKVIRDSLTQQSKGFAFVCFVRREEAESAIQAMNGQWLGGKTIRVNWASGKGSTSATSKPTKGRPTLNYDDVYNQASSTNTTVYCGGIQSGLTEDLLRQTFGEYGTVMDVRIFKEKCFAFVRLDTKEAAARAICGVHGTELNGCQVRCSWGKEVGDPTGGSSQSPQKSSQHQAQTKPQENAYGGGMAPAGGQGYYMPMQAYWGYQQAYQAPMQPGMQQGQGYMAPYNQQMNYPQMGYGMQGYGYANYAAGGGRWPGPDSGYSGQ